jgi:multiple sugar transport system ATP-binding protein
MKNLVINNLVQSYTYGNTGVNGLSMECGGGECTAVLAAQEGGKTSLLKCIAGLYPAQSGEILINGVDITKKPPKDRDVMLLYEDGGLFNLRTVYYNLAYPLKIRKINKETTKQIILSVAKKIGISDILFEKISTLNGCQKLLVMFARTKLRKASVYLFDDIFRIAEPQHRQELFSRLLPHIKELEGAVLFATSKADEAMSVGQNIIIMNYGYVVDEGDINKLKNSPRCLTSYKFMHSYATNMLTVKVGEYEEGVFIELLGKRIALDVKKLINPIYIGGEVTACFETLAEGDIKYGYKYIEYYNNTPFMHSDINGVDIVTKTENGSLPQGLNIDLHSLKLFDINSENCVYYG